MRRYLYNDLSHISRKVIKFQQVPTYILTAFLTANFETSHFDWYGSSSDNLSMSIEPSELFLFLFFAMFNISLNSFVKLIIFTL